MTTSVTTSEPTNEGQANSPEYDDTSIQQDKGQKLYFQRSIYRDYMDSSESNPDLDIAWDIFSKTRNPTNDYEFKMASILSADLSSVNEIIDYLIRGLYYKSLQLRQADDEEAEEQLFIHDYREPGLTMNWKKARELYKRIYED